MHAVGAGMGKGYSINVPWDTASEKRMPGDEAYNYAFEQLVMPVATEFAPDLVL
eukprot:COSAG06_NODE_45303_length_356_cov_0.556420_1_plen_53_part_01